MIDDATVNWPISQWTAGKSINGITPINTSFGPARWRWNVLVVMVWSTGRYISVALHPFTRNTRRGTVRQ